MSNPTLNSQLADSFSAPSLEQTLTSTVRLGGRAILFAALAPLYPVFLLMWFIASTCEDAHDLEIE